MGSAAALPGPTFFCSHERWRWPRGFYWTDPQKSEVDFVVFRNNRVEQLIQVCADAENPKTEAREIRGLLKASRALGCENLLLLTESERGQQRETWLGIAAEIRRMPISDWLIEN